MVLSQVDPQGSVHVDPVRKETERNVPFLEKAKRDPKTWLGLILIILILIGIILVAVLIAKSKGDENSVVYV